MKNPVILDISLSRLPHEVFAYFSAQPWSVLLDSAATEHPDNNFTILSANPLIKIETYGRYSQLSGAISSRSDDDPLALVQSCIEAYLPAQAEADCALPFTQGALGLFGYDLGRRFEHMPTQAKADIQVPDMAVGIYTWSLIYDHAREQYQLACFEEDADALIAELVLAERAATASQAFSLTTDWSSNMSENEYKNKFDRVQAYLKAGDCYQINLAQRFSADYQGEPWQAYLALREKNRAPFSAFIRLPDEKAILSISPERFISHRGGQVQTKPIKGTLPRGATAQEDKAQAEALALSEKDRAENLMIVDLLRNDLGKVAAPGSVEVPALFHIESFPAVHHLVSTITATLDEQFTPLDLLRGAFPGGSITGAPKIRAMEIIEELEPHRRNAYCGSIGYLSNNGNMDTSITIRTLVCDGKTLYCWAGGGVVADSTAEREYQETFDKVAKILPVLRELT